MSIDRDVGRDQNWRPRCYGCYRPLDRCFCEQIPVIENRTEVLIFQHKRERLHPFNTARILGKALSKSQLVVGHIDELANALCNFSFSDQVGLLYPGPGSQLLEELSSDEMPKQLVVLDGTWHHTKTLFRDISQLQRMPKFRLAPSEPSRYGIRREPHVLFLSTLEATVAALSCIEPETLGFERLISAFISMIDNQLAHPKSEESVRRKRRPRAPLNIPKVLRNDLSNVVVVYGETAPSAESGDSAEAQTNRGPIYWVAERLGSGERFECAIQPSSALLDSFLAHLALSHEDFRDAVAMDEFRRKWAAFLKPTDTLAYYYSNCIRLLEVIGLRRNPTIYLKSIQLHRGKKNGTLEDLLVSLQIIASDPKCFGRPGKRLALSIALTKYLSDCALVSSNR